jgi:hypothetical protein
MKSNARKLVQQIQLVQKIQASMVKSAADTFEETDLDGLRTLIRLTVEFRDYLQNGHGNIENLPESSKHYLMGLPPKELKLFELRYAIDSIFSGIDSFRAVNCSYEFLVGATDSKIAWGKVTESSLRRRFSSLFHKFTKEKQFEKRCRLLLDLFKIQIVFAGLLFP